MPEGRSQNRISKQVTDYEQAARLLLMGSPTISITQSLGDRLNMIARYSKLYHGGSETVLFQALDDLGLYDHDLLQFLKTHSSGDVFMMLSAYLVRVIDFQGMTEILENPATWNDSLKTMVRSSLNDYHKMKVQEL